MPNKNSNRKKEGSVYDKIIRENLLELFLPLVAEQLNFTIKKISPLPDKQPTTVIRETDSFLLIETDSLIEPKFILHIEFERKDNPNMIYRIAEYHGIELRKYRLPIKHVIVYLGDTPPKMRTTLRKEEIFESFTLVKIHETSPQTWLEYDKPERIIMAVLGNYQKENAKIILESIFNKLRRVCKSDNDLKKFIKQLIIISRMRNLEQLTIKMSNEMPILIDIEKDYLYNLGKKSQEHLLVEAKEALKNMKAAFKQATKENAEKIAKAKAEVEKATKENAEKIAKAKAEVEKAAKEKAEEIAKAKAEVEKAAKEKAEEIAKAKAEVEKATQFRMEKKQAILKMKKADLEDDMIMDFLNLNQETFDLLLMEIKQNNEK